MSSPYKTFSYYTFGCKVNFADSSYISGELIDLGMSQVSIDSNADICFINTCSVTENADKKANRIIRNINKRFPNTKIVVMGCYAQLKPDEIMSQKGVVKVVGAYDKFDINKLLSIGENNLNYDIKSVDKFNITYSQGERTRAFIKVQDGCNYTCSYCTIPLARGKSRSASISQVVDSINKIVSQGFKEIVLSGINIGDFGFETQESFELLLYEIEKIKNLNRYRISSIEPNLIPKEILNIMAKSKKSMPHFHIPLQSGSNKILKLMKRRYTVEQYREKIDLINKMIPNVNIGVDVIVGFPNESKSDFEKTYNLLSSLDVAYFHVFTYSERQNTKAQNIFPKIDEVTKKNRRKLLMNLSYEKNQYYINKNLDYNFKVLFENSDEAGIVSGLTENYIRVYAQGNDSYINKIKDVKIVKNCDIVHGEIID